MAFHRVLLALLLLGVGAHAASRSFQPPLQAPVLKSLRSNSTAASSAGKRWVITTTGRGDADIQPWVAREVWYAYPSDYDKQQLEPTLRAGLRLWHSSGLSEDFRWTEMSINECNSDRGNCLLVMLNFDGVFSTSVARPPSGDNFPGPVMKFDMSRNWGVGMSGVATMAHEMGHAWGLIHEHQDPHHWASGSVDNAQGGNNAVFHAQNFLCGNVPGHAAALARAQADPQRTAPAQDICRNVMMALKYNFAASSYLPYPASMVVSPADGGFDKQSIMLYGTNQEGSPILYGRNMEYHFPNMVPSVRDVAGILVMYDEVSSGRQKPTLFNVQSHPQHAAFQRIACSDS